MKKMLAIMVSFLIVCGVSFADAYSDAAMSTVANKFANGIGIGVGNSNGTTSSVGRWSPDFRFGDIGLGVDVNFVLGDNKDSNIQTVVVRYVEYGNSMWGVKYGLLKNITFGQGLLMDNYTTVTKGGIIPSNKQTGVKGYFRYGMYGVDALTTWTNLYVVRVTEDIPFQMPFVIGQYYITDTDGVNFKKTTGETVNYSSPAGIGLDAAMPLFPGASAYAEYAKLQNHGGGLSFGVSAAYDIMIAKTSLRAERRMIDYNFVPGYFNEDYETNPINLTSYEASSQSKDGFKVAFNLDVLSKGTATAVLEGYNGSNTTLKANAYLDITQDYFAAASFSQPNFKDARSLDMEQGAIITGKLGYSLNQFTNVIANYKKAYDADLGKVVETQWYEFKLLF